MEWSIEDKKALLSFKTRVDNDNIKIKEIIKKILLNNRFIIHVLNNKILNESEAEPDEYFGECILPYYIIAPTQHASQNFICYEVGYEKNRNNRTNALVKTLHITFYIVCEQMNLIDDETGIARHDLLAALIQNEFNYSVDFGPRIQLISDEPSVVDKKYAVRTLVFRQITDSNLVKTLDGVPTIINKDMHSHG